jgi:hypothetical protein
MLCFTMHSAENGSPAAGERVALITFFYRKALITLVNNRECDCERAAGGSLKNTAWKAR